MKISLKFLVVLFVFVLLTKCEKETVSILPEDSISSNEPIEKPKIESFSLKDLSTDDTFNDLTSTYGILQPQRNTKTKSKSIYKMLDSLNITIDPNTIKKISSNGYVSYTMLMIEPDDNSNDYSNLVIQEKDGVKRVFTVRYKQKVKPTKTKSSSNNTSSTYSYDIEMRSGMNPHQMWEEEDGSGGSGTSGDCEEYETVCNTVSVWSSVCSCRGHFPEEYCTCTGERIPFVQTTEECEDYCKWDNYTDPPNNNNNNGTGTGNGGTNTDNSTSTDVATSPINSDGTLAYVQIFNTLTDKAKCVYDKLNESSTDFVDAIKKFDGEFPVSHLKISSDSNMSSNTKKAHTTPPANYLIEIVLNGNSSKDASYQKRPNLLVAKTIIHEVIHAEMWRKILSIIENGGNVSGLTTEEWTNKLSNSDYAGIFDYYTRFGINDFQHPQMAAHYRDVIADALEDFDNNNNSRQFYEDLAWEGLIYNNDPTWNNLSESERLRIENVIDTYINENQNESCE